MRTFGPKLMALSFALGCVACAGSTRSVVGPAAEYRAVLAASDIDGVPLRAAGEAADATLFVVFASWCGPCQHELALLGELRQEHSRLRIIGLNAYEDYADRSDEQRLRAFLADNAPWLRVVVADRDMLAAFGGVPNIPSMFLYDGDGQLVQAYRRNKRLPPDRNELSAAIASALP